jgi:hypothetical protein
VTDEEGRTFADMVSAAAGVAATAFIKLGSMMADAFRHYRALDEMEKLMGHPLDQLARATGESEEDLIAELQSGTMDYREFYWSKMSQVGDDA